MTPTLAPVTANSASCGSRCRAANCPGEMVALIPSESMPSVRSASPASPLTGCARTSSSCPIRPAGKVRVTPGPVRVTGPLMAWRACSVRTRSRSVSVDGVVTRVGTSTATVSGSSSAASVADRRPSTSMVSPASGTCNCTSAPVTTTSPTRGCSPSTAAIRSTQSWKAVSSKASTGRTTIPPVVAATWSRRAVTGLRCRPRSRTACTVAGTSRT